MFNLDCVYLAIKYHSFSKHFAGMQNENKQLKLASTTGKMFGNS